MAVSRFNTILLLTVFILSPVAVAQQPVGSETSIDEETFEIDFEGGTIAEYVEMLRTKPSPSPLNLVVTQSARSFELPSIKVQTNMDGAVGIMEACSNEYQVVELESDPTGNAQIVRVNNMDEVVVTVMNAKHLLSKIEEEDFVDAIQMGLEMQGPISKVELKLHPATGLLFAKGTSRGTHLVEEIVGELSNGLTRTNSSQSPRGGGKFGSGGGAPGGTSVPNTFGSGGGSGAGARGFNSTSPPSFPAGGGNRGVRAQSFPEPPQSPSKTSPEKSQGGK